jgi:outer membrane protein assembly factor BamB
VGRRSVVWRESLVSKIRERYDDPCPRGLSFVATRPGYVIAKSGAHLVDVSLADGSLGWGLPISVPHIAPLVHDDRMYIWSAPADWTRTRVTLDTTTGDVIREHIRPQAAENRLVIVNGSTGEVVVNQLLSVHGPTFAQFQEPYGGAICRKHVLFTTNSGLMALFRLSDGELVWQHEYGGYLFSPVVDENRVYVASTSGNLILFEAEGGEL